MVSEPAVPVIAHAIQLAVAPVFLVSGIAALLGVMAGRLARIIDRARHFEDLWPGLDESARVVALAQLAVLEQRRILASWAINFCTLAALLVCLVVATLFVDAMTATELKWLAGALFVGSMLALIAGLGCFLREVYRSSRTAKVSTERLIR